MSEVEKGRRPSTAPNPKRERVRLDSNPLPDISFTHDLIRFGGETRVTRRCSTGKSNYESKSVLFLVRKSPRRLYRYVTYLQSQRIKGSFPLRSSTLKRGTKRHDSVLLLATTHTHCLKGWLTLRRQKKGLHLCGED